MAKYIDLHSHIAWGIDDGMPCVEDAVSSLESAKKDGIVGICSTPHFIPGQLDVHIYNEMVTRQLELRKTSPIPIYFGGEVMMNSEFIEGLELDLYPTLNSSRYMLVEYNVLRDIHSIDYRDECLYELKMKGFVPVLPSPSYCSNLSSCLSSLVAAFTFSTLSSRKLHRLITS